MNIPGMSGFSSTTSDKSGPYQLPTGNGDHLVCYVHVSHHLVLPIINAHHGYVLSIGCSHRFDFHTLTICYEHGKPVQCLSPLIICDSCASCKRIN